MSNWKFPKNAAAIVSILAAFHIFTAGVQASGGGIYNEGTLAVTGTTLGNEIHITYTREGVAVIVDGQEQFFREPVHIIAVDAVGGDNLIQYQQWVTRDIALNIVSGDGNDAVDVEFDLIEPFDGRIPTFAVDVDAGGRVKVKFSWLIEGAEPQFDFTAGIGGGSRFRPEIGDEVLLGLEYGDPDRPVIVGLLYNTNTSGAPAGTGQPRLGLRNLARSVSVVTELQLHGGAGNDEVEFHADYTGIRLQQGALLLDADLNEGDNRFSGQYFIAATRHAFISNNITAGDGDNQISLIAHELTHAVQQRAGITDGTSNTTMVSEINLGHGDNIVQANVTDFAFIKQLAELGDGDNLIDLASVGPGDVDVSLTLGDGRNNVHIPIVITDGKNNAVEGEALATLVVNKINAGDGDNTIATRIAKIDPFTLKQAVVKQEILLGDGDNHAHLIFGDGVHGARLPTGQNNISATYRSGSGSDTIVIDGEWNAPVAAEFVLDPGGENNTLNGRYVFGDWSTSFAPDGPRAVPSQMKVILMAPIDDLSFIVEEQPPADAPRKPAEFLIITMGQKTQGSLEFQRLLGVPLRPAGGWGDNWISGGTGQDGSADEPIFVPIRRFLMHDISADELSFVMNDGDSSVALGAGDITLKRGVSQSNAVAIETLKLENEGWEVEFDGLDVFGSFALEQELHGTASSSTTLRDVHVHENATAYWDKGFVLLDVTDPAPPSGRWFGNPPNVSLEIHDLQVDGEFGARTQYGDASLEMALSNAAVGSHSAEWTDFHAHDPGITRSTPAKPDYLQITMSDVLVSGWFDTRLDTGSRDAVVSYIQDHVATESFLATMDVQLSGGDGNDTILALLRDIATDGGGTYNFTAGGGAGDDLIAVLTRNLYPGAEGSMSFDLFGGDGNDTLALAVPAPMVRDDSIFASIDGGRGFNTCFATPGVLIENCHHHLNDDDILRLLRRHLAPLTAAGINSKEYNDEWTQALY